MREWRKERKKVSITAVAKVTAVLFFCWQFFAVSPFFVKAESEQNEWRVIASFSTWYSQKDVGRCENIAIASSFIDGVIIQPYGEFSFNQTVGKRTKEQGFKNAKIIQNGEYVQGVGGGVCQVSTTLYNAALLSGLEVTEFHAHSLAVGYVDPSRDAMVSSSSDLQLFNRLETPVKLCAKVGKGEVKVSFLTREIPNNSLKGTLKDMPQNSSKEMQKDSLKGGKQRVKESYKISVCILAETPPPKREIRFGEEELILQSPKNGVESEAYLEKYENGVLIFRKLIRKDVYAPVREIILKKIDDTTKKLP